MFGYWGKLLRVDLTKRKIETKEIEETTFKQYLGGAGLASKIIYDELSERVKPLDPENLLIFGVGPFQGTGIPGSGRWAVSALSPQTGIWGDSNGGGYWGPEFKRTGYDSLVISGRASSPVYLWLKGENAEIRDAEGVWGKKAFESDKAIKEQVDDPGARTVVIGSAGERQVVFSCVVSDHGYAGRSGMGAVMGSKNLKAVAVKGMKTPEMAKPEEFKERSRNLFRDIAQATADFRKYGTTDAAKGVHDGRGYGLAKNWREGKFEGIVDIVGDRFLEITKNPIACADCPIACHRHTVVKEPTKYAYDGYGPEYETIGMIGWLNQIKDPKAIAYAGYLCDEYGIDTITAGSTIGFIMECYEKGFITKEDLGGVEAVWGSADAAIDIIHKVAKREGIGDLLARGLVEAAEELGGEAPGMVVHVKGLDLPAHDPRGFMAMAVNYATGPRGGCHQRGFILQDESTIPEWGIPEIADTYSVKEPVYSAARYQDWAGVFNSLIQCEYMTAGGLTLTDQIDLLNLVTGWDLDKDDMQKIGERIFTLQRLINMRYGITGKDDVLPPRMFKPVNEGVSAGKVPEPFDEMLKEYYSLRGWNADGKPTAEKIKELGLD
jgi:aldehyde:ferredoxin oxidoreductase